MLGRRRDLRATPSKLRRQPPLREGPASAALACPHGRERQPRYRLAKINFNAKAQAAGVKPDGGLRYPREPAERGADSDRPQALAGPWRKRRGPKGGAALFGVSGRLLDYIARLTPKP